MLQRAPYMIGTGSMFEGKGEVLGMFEEKGEVLVWKCVAFYFYAAARVVDIQWGCSLV